MERMYGRIPLTSNMYGEDVEFHDMMYGEDVGFQNMYGEDV